jgi:hypothetical protein
MHGTEIIMPNSNALRLSPPELQEPLKCRRLELDTTLMQVQSVIRTRILSTEQT